MTTRTPSSESAAGAAVYSKATLSIYDLWVVRFSNSYAWQCPAEDMVAHYNEHISANHLDVGVGTGFYLDACQFPVDQPRLALMDLNSNSLDTTAQRLSRYQPTTHVADVLRPIDFEGDSFDSVGVNYLIHCLPGTMVSKRVLFEHLEPLMAEGAVLFGSTILGEGVQPNVLARLLMGLYNARGIFSNRQDNRADLERHLSELFSTYTLEVRGIVALFHARL